MSETNNMVVLLHGKPSTGKLTVAKRIEKHINENCGGGKKCYVFDNHFFNDIVFPYVNITPNLGKICKNVYKIRSVFLDTLSECSNYKNTVLVFTNVLLNSPDDEESVKELAEFAKKISAKFVPIELCAAPGSILGWTENKDRQLKHKLTDPEQMANFINNTKFLEIENSHQVINDTDLDKVCNDIISIIF